MGFFNDVVTTATGGVYSPDNGFSAPGLGLYTNTSYGQKSGLADMIPGIGDARAQDKANSQNIKLYNANQKWMTMMSNTAYQRAMDDMKQAGLNPMLAYQQGGASVPSSSPATVQAASKTGLASSALGAFTGISAARTQAQQASTAQSVAESSAKLQTAQTAKEIATVQNIQAETRLKERELRGKGIKDTLDREGGSIIQKIFDGLKNSAKDMIIKPAPPTTPAQKKFLEDQDKYIQNWKKTQGHK